jgi:nicotinate phosphoribosyltransferase
MSGTHGRISPLLTDLYELTMACGYWKCGLHEREAVFDLTFRKNPFHGGYSIACGLADAIDWLRDFRFEAEERAYLGTLAGAGGQPLFEAAFLDYLGGLRLACDVDAIPEGTVVFPHEPLVRVRGPLLHAQILETTLLTLINFQTLIATKAARVCQAAQGDPVLEFGLRRAQGIDGGMSASRAACIGGCAATSNVLAGMRHGIPVRGTHAHSWVMAFDTEGAAFEAWAGVMPHNAVFLVDTYDTLEGVRNAVQAARLLREKGREMAGIRLDSGDLARLSIEARRILDEGGFPDAAIFATSDLDEYAIARLKAGGARVTIWGVGTRLVTAYDEPALGGVYKLTAIQGADGAWQPKLKLSEQSGKISNPGIHQVRRFQSEGMFTGDVLIDVLLPANPPPGGAPSEDLLVPIFRRGELVYDPPPLDAIRRRSADQLARLAPGIRRFQNPDEYPVRLDPGLEALKARLVRQARRAAGSHD